MASSDANTQGHTCGGTIERIKGILSLMASPLTDETGSTASVVAGLATIVAVGTIVGLVAPVNEVLSPSYRKISAALGYIYFMAWSVSFYPQVISNHKRKSTVGLSPDFVVLNVIGFGCYTAYNASLFWNESIREDYKQRYGPDAEITVQSNDVAFAVHALLLSLATLCQIVFYNHNRRGDESSDPRTEADGSHGNSNRASRIVGLSRPVILVVVGIAAICTGYPLLVVWSGHHHRGDGGYSGTGRNFHWLDFLYVLSYIKIFISLVKYIPQVVLNFQRKSTVGWSIWNILLDFTGGVLSDLQLVLDCADRKDFSGITHNKAKLALGSLSIVFDLVFLVQHYCLYSGNTTTTIRTELNEPLLSQVEETDHYAATEREGFSAEQRRTIFAEGEGSPSPASEGPRTIFV